MSEHPTESRDELIFTVQAHVEELMGAARQGESDAIAELLNLAIYLADEGLPLAAGVPVAALEELDKDKGLAPSDLGWLLSLRGRLHLAAGNMPAARDSFGAALTLARGLSDPDLLAASLLNVGNMAWLGGHLAEARRLFVESRAARRPEDGWGRAQASINLAGVYLDEGKVELAASLTDALLEDDAVRAEPRLRVSVLGLSGLIAVQQADLERAASAFQQSARLASRSGATEHLLNALQNLGSVNLDLDRPGAALRPLRRAERIALRIGSYRGVDAIQRTLATALHRRRRNGDAAAVLRDAIGLAVSRNDTRARARLVADLGSLELLRRHPREAEEHLRSALATFIDSRDVEWSLKTMDLLASALVSLGRGLEVVGLARQTLATLQLAAAQRATFHESIGDVLLPQCQAEAIRSYEDAIGAYRLSKQPLVDHLARIGTKLAEADEHREAVKYLSRAIRGYKRGQGVTTLAQLLNDRGLALAAQALTDRALVDLIKSLTEAREADDRLMQALVQANLSELYRRAGRSPEAIAAARAATRLAHATGNIGLEAGAQAALGLALGDEGESLDADEAFRVARRLARQVRDIDAEAVALGGLGRLAFVAQRYRRARGLYQHAAELERSQRDVVHETEFRAALIELLAILGDVQGSEAEFQRLVDLVQQDRGPIETALTGIERAGAAWLRAGNLEAASDAFTTGILLAAVDPRSVTPEQTAASMARPIVAAFVYAELLGPGRSDALGQAIETHLRQQIGRKSASALAGMFPVARDEARRVVAARQEPSS